MKKILPVFSSLALMLLTGCSRSFFGTFLVLGFRDMVSYVGLALIISIIVAVLSNDNQRRAFWISFILSLVLTPIAGLVYCLILLTKR